MGKQSPKVYTRSTNTGRFIVHLFVAILYFGRDQLPSTWTVFSSKIALLYEVRLRSRRLLYQMRCKSAVIVCYYALCIVCLHRYTFFCTLYFPLRKYLLSFSTIVQFISRALRDDGGEARCSSSLSDAAMRSAAVAGSTPAFTSPVLKPTF